MSMYATCVECEEKEETHLAFLCINNLEQAVFYLVEGFQDKRYNCNYNVKDALECTQRSE